MTDQKASHIVELAAAIVSAYVAKNALAPADLPKLIHNVYESLTRLGTGAPPAGDQPKPAVPPRKSVFDDYLICLEDGKRFKSLKRHLRAQYNMTPAQYREKWGLAADYPMVAPNYAKARSRLAREMGLGQQKKD